MRALPTVAVCLGMLFASSAPLVAQEQKAPATPEVFSKVLDCRALTDTAARLACFDQTVAAMASAQEAEQLVVVDKAEIREARRGLFGFKLPKIRLFGGGDDDSEEASFMEPRIDSLDAKVTGVSGDSGSWVLTLDTGARWQQIDGEYINRPAIGADLSIKRGQLGGYTAKAGTGRAFKVRRLPE